MEVRHTYLLTYYLLVCVYVKGSRKGLLEGHSCLLSFSPNSMVCACPSRYPQGEKVGSLHLFSNDEYDLLCHINVS